MRTHGKTADGLVVHFLSFLVVESEYGIHQMADILRSCRCYQRKMTDVAGLFVRLSTVSEVLAIVGRGDCSRALLSG